MKLPPLLHESRASARAWGVMGSAAVLLPILMVLLSSSGPWITVALCVVAAAAPVLALVDWLERRLPDLLTLPVAALVAVLLTAQAVGDADLSRLGAAALWGGGSVAFFLVLHLLAPASLGFGDVKLMLSLGPLLAWFGPIAVMAGVILGLVSALLFGLMAIMLGRADRRSHLALGPHLIIGSLVVLVIAA